jgi:hypothetical protein
MLIRIIAGLCALFAAAPAQAAIYNYGCLGRLGDEQVIFDRDALCILRGGAHAGRPLKFSVEYFGDTVAAAKASKDLEATYVPADAGGLDETMKFMRENDETRRVIFVEKSSRRVSHKHRTICWRSEDTNVYRKVFTYQRENEELRGITMRCYEYQLSTKGGHEGCD